MFKLLAENESNRIDVLIDGETLRVPSNMSVAGALLMRSPSVRSTFLSDQPRGPFCMMGVCFDCLVSIDDIPNQRACMFKVRPGMRIETRRGPAGAKKTLG